MTSIPKRCAELRADLIERASDPRHVKFLDAIVQSSRLKQDRLFPREWDGADLGEHIERTARMAEMWTATTEMMDLIVHASESLPPQVLKREAIPSQQGFLYLPVPLWITDIRGDRLPVRVIMWSERTIGREGESPGRGMPEVARGLVIDAFMVNGEDGDRAASMMPRAEWARIMAEVPSLSLFHSMSIAFDAKVWDVDTSGVQGTPDEKAEVGRRVLHNRHYMRSLHDGDEVEQLPDGRWLVRTADGHVVTAMADRMVQFLHAYFAFSSSTLSAFDRERLPKSQLRWMRRLGIPDSPISVLRLRRREQGDETGNGGQLSYRHVRRGHWRRQWYGSGEGRYQQHIWIAPTIVGPADGELRIRDVVNLAQF